MNMLALNETATLYPCVGRGGGRPVYAARGEAFRCRSEAAYSHAPRGDAIARGAELRVFAVGIQPRPGDRIELDGRYYRIARVEHVRGWAGIHHLELLANAEEARG